MGKTPEDIAIAGAEAIVGACLRYDVADLPPEQATWLKGFLRGHLTGPEWRLVAEAYGWRKEPRPGEKPDAEDADKGDDPQADMIALMGLKVAEQAFANRFPVRPVKPDARKPS